MIDSEAYMTATAFYEIVEKRRTIRDFMDKVVPDEVLNRILAAGLKASSYDHARDWHFVVIREEHRIADVLAAVGKKAEWQMEVVRNWTTATDKQREMYFDAVPKQIRMLMQSRCLVLPLFKAPEKLMAPQGLTDLNSFASIWCVIENMLLAATAEGLGSALRIPIYDEEDYVLQKICAPKDYKFPCYLAFGYPAPDAPVIRQTNCPLTEHLHFEKW